MYGILYNCVHLWNPNDPRTAAQSTLNLANLRYPTITHGGFLKWWYPNSWMVYGQSTPNG